MAYGFDASSILSSYMEGANFVARGMERAEERAKAERAEKIRGFVGQYMAATTPQFDDKGQPVGRSMTDIMNSPEFKDMANDPLLQPYLSQGITDPAVKRTHYVGAVPDPSEPDNGGKAVPVLQHVGADGKPLAPPGPLTSDRSRDGSATVVPLNSNNVAGVLVKAAYAVDPTLGHEILNRMHLQSVQGFRTLYRNAKTDAEREGLLRSAGESGIEPELIYSHSGAPTTIEHPTGMIETRKPGGSVSITYDPKLYAQTGGAGLRQSEDVKLGIDEDQLPRKLTLRNVTAENDAATNLGIEEKQLPRKLAIREATQNQDALVENTNKDRFQPNVNQRAASSAASQHESTKKLTQQDNAEIERLVAGLDSADPAVRDKSKNDLLAYSKSPEEARQYVVQAKAESHLTDLRSALGSTSDSAYRAIAKDMPYATEDTQHRIHAQLEALAQSDDPVEREIGRGGLAAAINVMKGPQKPEVFKPAPFQASHIEGYVKGESNLTKAEKQQAINGTIQSYSDLVTRLGISENSDPTIIQQAHQAAADAHILGLNKDEGAFGSKARHANATMPMFLRAQVQHAGYDGLDTVTDKRQFVEEVYDPIVKGLGFDSVNDPQSYRQASNAVTVALAAMKESGERPSKVVAATLDLLNTEGAITRTTQMIANSPDHQRGAPVTPEELGRALAKQIKAGDQTFTERRQLRTAPYVDPDAPITTNKRELEAGSEYKLSPITPPKPRSLYDGAP